MVEQPPECGSSLNANCPGAQYRMTKRKEAFGQVLSASLVRVIDFLKFAETKNAALLTFASAWTFASISVLTGERAPAGILGGAYWVALILFSGAAVVAILSLLPKLNLHAFHRDPTKPNNLLYFGHIAEFDTALFRTRVQERYLGEGDQSPTDEYLDDLMVQISVNSKIASWKFGMFNLGARLVLIALLFQWYGSEQRQAKRSDRAADRDGDKELEAYNAYLASLNTRGN